ncbi:hypothetical protein L1887_53982 [Cichorium endivia]|nr:hypothetical protein L1887_53982 [Cichorium endivia]
MSSSIGAWTAPHARQLSTPHRTESCRAPVARTDPHFVSNRAKSQEQIGAALSRAAHASQAAPKVRPVTSHSRSGIYGHDRINYMYVYEQRTQSKLHLGHATRQSADGRHRDVRRAVGLDARHLARQRQLVRPRLVHLGRQQQMVVAVVGHHARRHRLEDLGRDRILVVGHVVVRDELLDLRRRQHPADVVDNVNVAQRRLLELQQLGRLHEVLQLQRPLGHVVRLAPLLDSRDVVLDLHRALPRAKVAAHQQIVEARHADQLQQLRHHLLRHRRFHVVALEALPHLVVLDDRHQTLVVAPLERARRPVHARSDALQHVALGDAHKRQDLVHVGQPKDARDDRLLALERHDVLLDRLHHVGQEALRFAHQAVLPHLVGHQRDEVRWEQHLLGRRRVLQARSRHLEESDESVEHVLVQLLLVLQDADDLLGRVVLVVLFVVAVALAAESGDLVSVQAKGDRDVAVGGCGAALGGHHGLFVLVAAERLVAPRSRLAVAARSALGPAVGVAVLLARRHVEDRRRCILDALRVLLQRVERVGAVELLAERGHLGSQRVDRSDVVLGRLGGAVERVGASLQLVGLTLDLGREVGDALVLLGDALERRLLLGVELALGSHERLELGQGHGGLGELLGEATVATLDLVVLALPREDLLLERLDLARELLVVLDALLQVLGELDNLVLELVRDLLKVRHGLGLVSARDELLLGKTTTVARLQVDDALSLLAVLPAGHGTSQQRLETRCRELDLGSLVLGSHRTATGDALDLDDGVARGEVLLASQEAACDGLDLGGSGGLTQIVDVLDGQAHTPPGLNLDGVDAHRLVLLLLDVAPEVLLDDGGDGIEAVGPPLLELGEHAGTEEDLGETDLVFVLLGDGGCEDVRCERLDLVHVGHVPSIRRHEHVVSLGKVGKSPSRRVACTADADGLEHTAGPQLTEHVLRLDLPRLFGLVGLDAANVVDVGAVDRRHEADERALELRAEGGLLDARAGQLLGRRLGRGGACCGVGGLVGLVQVEGGVEDLLEEGVGGAVEQVEVLVWHRVLVLLDKAGAGVLDVERVVADGEAGLAEARLLEGVLELGSLVHLRVELLDEGLVGAGRQPGLLVEEREDAELALDHVDAGLVVGEVDKGPRDLLLEVLFLLELEDVVVELVLEALVGVVDAELLVRVDLESLEAVDIEDADHGLARLGRAEGERTVHLVDEPVEEAGVDVLGHRVTHDDGLRLGEVGDDLFAPSLKLTLYGPLAELGRVDAEHARGHEEAGLVVGEHGVGACGCDLDVSEVQEGGEEAEDVPLTLDGLHDGVRGEDLLLCLAHAAGVLAACACLAAAGLVGILDGGKVSHDVLCRHGLTGTGLTADDDGLVLLVADHAAVGIFCDGEEMWLELALASSGVGLDDLGAVEAEAVERVDGDEDDAGVGVDDALGVSVEDGVKDGGLVEVTEVGEVVGGLEERWVAQRWQLILAVLCGELGLGGGDSLGGAGVIEGEFEHDVARASCGHGLGERGADPTELLVREPGFGAGHKGREEVGGCRSHDDGIVRAKGAAAERVCVSRESREPFRRSAHGCRHGRPVRIDKQGPPGQLAEGRRRRDEPTPCILEKPKEGLEKPALGKRGVVGGREGRSNC